MKWPQIRAGLIALAIGIGLVEGCPSGLVKPVRSVQRALLSPVAWIGPALQITQRFALFQAAGTRRFRLEIDGQDAAHAWHSLYRAGTDDDAILEYRRVRGSYDPLDAPPASYRRFASWLGQRYLAEQPALAAVRVRFERVVLDLGEVRDTGEYVFPVVTVRR